MESNDSIGQQLRAARLRADLTVPELARRTCIRIAYLEGLEEERFDVLPSRYWTIAFVRLYARELGLDEDETVAAVKAKLGWDPIATVASQTAERHTPPPRSGRPTSRSTHYDRQRSGTFTQIFVALGLIAGGLSWWHYSTRSASESPQPNSAPAPATELVTAAELAATAETDLVLVDSDASSSGPQTVPPLEVEVQAREMAWVRFVADNAPATEYTLRAGERRVVDANSRVRLTLGNAGGVVLRLNGAGLPAMGQSGQVRHIEFTRDGWEFKASRDF